MSGPNQTDQRTATLAVLGILAIPILAVSSAAMLAEPVASANPVHTGLAIITTLFGVAVGLMVLRLVQAAIDSIRTAAVAVAEWVESDSLVSTTTHGYCFVVTPSTIPVASHHVRSLPRRGPPARL